jgi:outer membrane protein OmpA-like peptidoglycan-associated protein
MSNKLLPILFFSFLLSLPALKLNAQTTSTEENTNSLYGGINYQVQEFQFLNQQIGDDCNCLEGNRLNKRAIQSVSLSVLKLKQNWAWAAAMGYGSGYGMDDDKAYYSIRTLQTRADLFYHFQKPENRLRPFVGAGVQWVFNANSSLLSIPVGAGLRYRLPSGTYLHLQTAYDYGVAHALAQNLITQVGIHFNLGKSKQRAEAKSAKPIVAEPAAVVAQAKPEPAKSNVAATDPVNTADSAARAGQAAQNALAANTQPEKPSDKAEADKQGAQLQVQPQLSRVVYFDTDKWSLNKNETIPTLNEVLDFVNRYPNTSIVLSGHTDSILNQAYNLVLSRRRVEQVKNWLVEQGISATKIQTTYSGKVAPAASNETAEGRAKNRRVEILVK